MENGLIWDCEYKYPMILSESMLEMCDVYGVQNWKVTEVIQVVLQRMMRNSNEV